MNKSIYRIVGIFIVLALTLGSFHYASAASAGAPLGAAKIYIVDKNNIGGKGCNDGWAGSLDKPLCTVSAGLNRVQAGDTLYLRGGSYPGDIDATRSGISSAYITISSYNGEKVIISGGDNGIRLYGVSFVKVYGFEITGASGSYGAGISVTQKSGVSPTFNVIENNIVHDNLGSDTIGILIEDGSNNTVLNNKIYNNYFSGIWVVSHASQSPNGITGNQIIGNESYNNTLGGGNADGIGTAGEGTKNTLIMNNVVHGNGDDGIDTWNTSFNTLIGNIAYGQNGSGDGNGFKVGGSTTGGWNVVQQNIAYGNRSNGFDANGSGGNVFYNNVAFNNSGFGFEDGWKNDSCTVPTCPTTFVNNIGYNNVRGNLNASEFTAVSHNNLWYSDAGTKVVSYEYDSYATLAAFYAASGNRLDNPNNGDNASLQASPRFVNAPAARFTLQASSPAIDTGDSSACPSTDQNGVSRPQNGNDDSIAACDIGAYEYIQNNAGEYFLYLALVSKN
jgi:parallel beta-helix repeat protein